MAICTAMTVVFTLNADNTISVTSTQAPNFSYTSSTEGAESCVNVVRGLLGEILGKEAMA